MGCAAHPLLKALLGLIAAFGSDYRVHGCILTALRQLSVAVARGGVVHDHAAGLHEGVANGRADEGKPGFFQAFAHGLGFGRYRREFMPFGEMVDLGLAPHKRPQEVDGVFKRQPGLGIAPRAGHFQAVAHNPRIQQQGLDFGVRHHRQALCIKAKHDLAIVLTLAQNRDPRQPGLEPFEQ